MKKVIIVIMNTCLIILGASGILLTHSREGFMTESAGLYFTVQSNWLAMLTALLVITFTLANVKNEKAQLFLSRLRLTSTVSITLTFVVFSLLLAPSLVSTGNGSYLFSPDNLFVHNAVPLLAIFDWCFFGSAKGFKRSSELYGIIPAVCYTGFVYTCVALGVKFSGKTVPYFFFDYAANGWFTIGEGTMGVVFWLAILLGFLLGVSRLYIFIVKKREAKERKNEV